MMVTTQPRNRSLDVLRGIAILLVLGFHFPQYDAWVRIGWTGVYLFFVLSGFLVSGLLFDAFRSSGSVDARRFIVRRGFKIWPSFYLYLAAVGCFAILYRAPFPWVAISHAGLFVQNYLGPQHMFFTGHLWSLCVEEHFYLLLPLLFWAAIHFLGSKAMSAMAWLSGLSLVVCLGLRSIRHDLPSPESHLLIDNLFCGVLLSYVYRFRPEKFRLLVSHWSLAFAVVLFLPACVLDHDSRLMQTLGLPSMAIAFSLLLAWAIDRWPRNRGVASLLSGVAKIGFYSYTIYLWHLIVQLLVKGSLGVNFLSFWLYMAGSIALGVVMAQNTEQPFLMLREKLFPDVVQRRG